MNEDEFRNLNGKILDHGHVGAEKIAASFRHADEGTEMSCGRGITANKIACVGA
ncbi:MAG: hypothetical protein HN834_24995 [Rhodospirillaceae bacterium]|jgi:hypothetical protein|nr:hypothetical protein [Rhodospirillaceae bacterium]